MKKFYAIIAAALMSVSVFASKDVVPSDAVLADYYEPGQVCVCIFVPADMACNDIVLTGSFNGWTIDPSACISMENVEGYDGWYVAAYDPEAEPDPEKGLQAKPIMKAGDGSISWNYQVLEVTPLRGSVEVVAGFSGEIDLIHYGTDVPNVFTVEAWKQNPCTAVYHNYTVAVINEGCDGFVVPFIAGAFTGWGFQMMTVDVEKSIELGAAYFYHSFKATEEDGFQLLSGLMDAEGQLVVEPAWTDMAYLQENIDGDWSRINGGNNIILGEQIVHEFDLRKTEELRWARCAEIISHNYKITAKLPVCEGAPASVQIRGGWAEGTWSNGVVMTPADAAGEYFVEIEAAEGTEFKFCQDAEGDAGWANQIQVYNEEIDDWNEAGNEKLGKEENVVIKYNDGKHKWVECAEAPEGIENVTLSENAQKVIVDGNLYIVRDGKMFNAQGAQVR